MTTAWRPKALLSMRPGLPDRLFDAAARERLTAVYDVDVDAPAEPDLTAFDDDTLDTVEVVLTGWGAQRFDDAALARLPRLRGIHHAAGSVRSLVSEACWDRGVRVTSAADVNAIPVAEYAAAMILLAAKQVFRGVVLYRARRRSVSHEFPTAGSNGTVVGIIGASRIGRRVIGLLRPTDLEILVYDPTLNDEDAAALGVTRVTLDDVFRRAAVTSIHAPLLPETTQMVTRRLLASMPDGATLVNTARGGLVDHHALVDELVAGRLWAVLDTTDPYEPLPEDSPLYDLANVVLTPHMAGAIGNETFRLGDHAVDQAIRLHHGDPLDGEVTRVSLGTMA